MGIFQLSAGACTPAFRNRRCVSRTLPPGKGSTRTSG